jgi:hypothetical protein
VPLGIGVGQIVALVRETHAVEASGATLSVSGPGAHELAAALSDGGDPAAVVIGGDPVAAAVAIRLLDGEPSPADTDLHRRLARAGVPLIVLRPGGEPVPYVLPGDVLEAGTEPLPVGEIAAAIARAAPDAAPRLAARLPVLRPAVSRRLVTLTSIGNAALAASNKTSGPQLPLLALAQSRMLLLIGASRGETLPRDPQGVAMAAGPPVAATVVVGLAARTLVRRLPVQGPIVRAAIAFAGTRALGAARLRLP